MWCVVCVCVCVCVVCVKSLDLKHFPRAFYLSISSPIARRECKQIYSGRQFVYLAMRREQVVFNYTRNKNIISTYTYIMITNVLF
jgi:hypothetical protein